MQRLLDHGLNQFLIGHRLPPIDLTQLETDPQLREKINTYLDTLIKELQEAAQKTTQDNAAETVTSKSVNIDISQLSASPKSLSRFFSSLVQNHETFSGMTR